jgi:serine protease inhibitor
MNRVLLVILAVILFSGCEKFKNNKEPKSFPLTAKQQEVVTSGNEFTADILKKVNASEPDDKNLFFSPFSISMALGMTLNGAIGVTRDEMIQTLQLQGLSMDEINASYKYLIDNLVSLDKDVTFDIANSIWYRDDYTILPDFIQLNQDNFYAEVTGLDFSKAEESKNTINNWVSDKTHGKIEEIVDQIDPSSFMFLINALYFNANWKYQFDKSESSESDFQLSDGSNTQTTFMHQKLDVQSYSDDLLQAIELPYGEGNYSMVVMLPQYNKDVEDIIDAFSTTNWNSWLNNMITQQGLDIYLPKFSYDYEIELKDILIQLGMEKAFTGQAEFSNIHPNLPLYISKVKHKAFVDVHEEGTEAAAVTSVEINFTSIQEFRANKAFLFCIKERNTNAILFVGKLMNPNN